MTALDRSAAAHARATAGKIRQAMKDYWSAVGLVTLAYQQRHWEALGYESWDSYCLGEFGPERLGLPVEHSQKTLDVFRATGMSVRAIASATGVPKSSIGDALSQLSEAGQLTTPENVVGVDGKARPATQTPARRDPEPAHFPGPVVATPDEPDLPGEVALAAGGLIEGATSPSSAVQEFINDDPRVQSADYLVAFTSALSRAGGFMQFDAERIGQLAGSTTWDAIEAHHQVVGHWYETAARARKGLRVIKGGAA